MPIHSHKSKASDKSSKGDTSRTSSQGRKLASGGSKEVNNQGRPKGKDADQSVSATAGRDGR